MNKIKQLAGFFLVLCCNGLTGCDSGRLTDINMEMPGRNWNYAAKLKAVAAVTTPAAAYDLKFRLRHTSDYRYANIYILMSVSGPGMKKVTRRYQYKLAEADGQWLGRGSGNLYTYTLPLLSGFHFPAAGEYTIEIEQNMRDNPLREVSDAGILVAPHQGQ